MAHYSILMRYRWLLTGYCLLLPAIGFTKPDASFGPAKAFTLVVLYESATVASRDL